MPPLAYTILKGHNSRTIKVTLPKFVLEILWFYGNKY